MTSKAKSNRPAADDAVRELAEELQALDERHKLGDVRDKPYQKQRDELLEHIGREKVRAHLEPEEEILAEHHFVRAHFPFTRFAFQDVAQEALSFYATNRRLLRWRFRERPGARVASLCRRDDLDVLDYGDVQSLAVHRDYRWGEGIVAVCMLVLAALLWPLLEVTGPMLVLIAGLALLHVLFMPTRYLLIVAGPDESRQWRVYAANKKSARQLIATVREHLP